MKHKGRTWRKRQRKCVHDKPTSLADKPEYIDLFKWAKKNGVRFNKMRPCLFPGIGRGLMATGQINIRDILISVPHNLLITDTMLRQDYITPGSHLDIKTIDLLCMFLIIEHSLGTTSLWFPYINMLPKEFNTPSYFTEKDANILPPFLHEQWRAQSEKIKKCRENLKRLLCSVVTRRGDVLLTFESVRWAWNVVNTRCVYMKEHLLSRNEEMGCALAPLLDLLNHSCEVEVQAGFSQESHSYNIHTNTRFSKGDQVFINYGPHGNRKLLIEYGFMLPNNCQNSIKIETFEIDEIITRNYDSAYSENKYNIIQKYKLGDSYSCTTIGLSWTLRTALKILALDETRLHNKSLDIGDLVLTANEKGYFLKFSKFILASLLEKYNGYFTTIKSSFVNEGILLSSSPQDRVHLVCELLIQENEILTNALTMLEYT